MKKSLFLILAMMFLCLQAITAVGGPMQGQAIEQEQEQEQTRDDSMARIVTSQGQAEMCISPMAITRIDGLAVRVSHKEFQIDPGIHQLNGRAAMNMQHCQPLEKDDRLLIEDLEAEFEAGRSYFVGFDHSDADISEWKLVVWMVEEG